MSLEYLRKVKLTVSGASNNAYVLSDMHIQFLVTSAAQGTLKTAEITIWNLSKEKQNAMLKEFTGITLGAGYEGQFGTIFDGQICRVEAGKENAVDSYVHILAQDGDNSKGWTMTRKTLAAGWTDDTLYKQLMGDFEDNGLTAGNKPTFTQTKGARAYALAGQAFVYFDQMARRQNCDWFIEDGKVNLLPFGTSLPGPQQVLRPDSGLIGVPKVTIGGINVRCLLNPNIQTGRRIEIQNSQIAQLSQLTPPQNGASDPIPTEQGAIDGNGIYTAFAVNHSGDTRGQEWYTDLVAVSIDGTGPKSGAIFTVASPI